MESKLREPTQKRAIEKKQKTVRLAKDGQADVILNEFHERNQQIQQEGFIDKEYQDFADTMHDQYLYTISPKWIGTRVMNRLLGQRFTNWYIKKRYKEKQRLVLQNYIECEAHSELILSMLQRKGE